MVRLNRKKRGSIRRIEKIKAGMTAAGGIAGQGRPPPELAAGVPVNADDKIGKVNVQSGKLD
jgi:hypothetical protein